MRIFAALLALLSMATVWSSPRALAQEAGSQRIAGKTFEKLAKTMVSSVQLTGDETLDQAAPIPDQIVAAGPVYLDVQTPLVNPSYVNVPIRIDVNGMFVRTVFVGYKVQRWVRTAVATRDIVAGTVLAAGDVQIARIPTFGRLPNGTDVLVGRKVVANFRKGQPIYVEETAANQIVKPGSSVVLVVNDGGVSVVTEVQARTGGGLGDEVSVYNPVTNKVLSGTVVGPDRVELDITTGGTQ